MAAGTSTPVEAGQGPGVLNIAASIGAKIRDAAESAKEEKEKAVEAGESPKKGSLFKSSLANQFNPIKSKKAKSKWANQFSWNKKSGDEQKVKAPPTGDGGGGNGKAKLKEFIAGGFTAILQDTAGMVSRLDGVKALTGENLAEVTRASSTLTVIKDSIDAQTELRRKALEEAKFARAEKKLEKTSDNAGVSAPSEDTFSQGGDGEGDGGGGGGLFDTLLGGLDGIESIMQIKNLLGGGQAAGAAAEAGGIGAGAAAAIVGGVGLAMSAGGEGMFQLGKMGDQQLKDRRKLIEEKKARGENTFLDETLQAGQTGLGEVGKTLGTAMDVGGAPFRYAIEALRNPFLNEEQKKEQAYNLAKFDTRVREHSRGWMNRIDFMNIIPDQKGGFGNIYGNDAATKEMSGKMSEGGMVPNAVPLARGGVVDNPTKTTLNPGDSVIPLNRNIGKQILGDKKETSPEDTALDTVGAMILGVSAGILGKTDSGTAGDAVKQDIMKASKEFGISNLTFTSDIGKGQFRKVDPNKSAKEFMQSLFKGIAINSSGGKGGSGGGGGGAPPPAAGNVAQDAVASLGKDSSSKDLQQEMNETDIKLEKLGLGGAIVGSGSIVGDEMSMAWCAAFVANKLARAGFKPPNSAFADAYRSDRASTFTGTPVWGRKIDPKEAAPNDVILFDWSGQKVEGKHVAIVTGNDGSTITYVGGNQGGGGGKVTEGKIGVNDKTLLMISRPTEMLPGATPQTQIAQAPPKPSAQQPAAAPTVKRVAESGMMSPSLGSITPVGSYIGYANGGDSMDARHAHAEKLRRQRASAQRSRLGVQKVNGKWVNMGVSDQAVGSNPWWQVWNKKGATAERRAKQEELAKSLAQRLNKQEGNLKPSRPAPARPPSSSTGTRPAPSQRASSSSAAVVTPPTPVSKTTAATAEASFGSVVPQGKTKAMIFADFLYPDLV